MSIFYWMQGENRDIKDVEKTEMLNAFFASVLNRKASWAPSTQLSELEERDGEKKEAP